MVLYESAFGLTMLRLYVQTAIVWVAFVVTAVGVAVVIGSVRRAWLAPAAALFALVLLFALNVLNPEAFVASHEPGPLDRLDARRRQQIGLGVTGALLLGVGGTVVGLVIRRRRRR